jgi:hypothetical protein
MAKLKEPYSRGLPRYIEQISHPLDQPSSVSAVALRRCGDADFPFESISQQVHPPSGHQERATKVTRLPLLVFDNLATGNAVSRTPMLFGKSMT